MARKFKWDVWDYDCDGNAYIIAKDVCPDVKSVPDFICGIEKIHADCKSKMVVEEGWCKYQVRSDWANAFQGEAIGGYVVERQEEPPRDRDGKKKAGWFPVWIVRIGDWY